MRFSRCIQPLSYLKKHSESLADDLAFWGEPLILTKGGRAKLVVQDYESYQRDLDEIERLKNEVRL